MTFPFLEGGEKAVKQALMDAINNHLNLHQPIHGVLFLWISALSSKIKHSQFSDTQYLITYLNQLSDDEWLEQCKMLIQVSDIIEQEIYPRRLEFYESSGEGNFYAFYKNITHLIFRAVLESDKATYPPTIIALSYESLLEKVFGLSICSGGQLYPDVIAMSWLKRLSDRQLSDRYSEALREEVLLKLPEHIHDRGSFFYNEGRYELYKRMRSLLQKPLNLYKKSPLPVSVVSYITKESDSYYHITYLAMPWAYELWAYLETLPTAQREIWHKLFKHTFLLLTLTEKIDNNWLKIAKESTALLPPKIFIKTLNTFLKIIIEDMPRKTVAIAEENEHFICGLLALTTLGNLADFEKILLKYAKFLKAKTGGIAPLYKSIPQRNVTIGQTAEQALLKLSAKG